MAARKEPLTGLNIGALSNATGIAAETLRTWERRYGFPCADRTEGGHRLYSPALLEHLRLAQLALNQGHRAGAVLRLPLDQLERLLASTSNTSDTSNTSTSIAVHPPWTITLSEAAPSPSQVFALWLDAIAHLDALRLELSFRQLWYTHGPLPFIQHYAGPFTTRLGEAWATGELSVHHEHFASERLRDFLTAHWRPLSDRASGPTILCTTLPEERHTLGLHMAAVVLAICGCKLIFLGESSPLADIIHLAAALPSLDALVISCSCATPPALAIEQLRTLRAGLDSTHTIIVGGRGAPSAAQLDGIMRLEQFEQLIPHFL